MSSDDSDEEDNSRPGMVVGISPALRVETYARLPKGLERLQEDLRDARAASVALLGKLPERSVERDLLRTSERRLVAYMLLFMAIVRATIDDVEPSMFGKNSSAKEWKRARATDFARVRATDIANDYEEAIKRLEKFVVVDNVESVELPALRERLKGNLKLFRRAAEMMPLSLAGGPARVVHDEIATRFGGIDSSWFQPYGRDETQSRAS